MVANITRLPFACNMSSRRLVCAKVATTATSCAACMTGSWGDISMVPVMA